MHDIGEDGVDMHGEKALLGAVTLSVASTPRGKLDVISFFGIPTTLSCVDRKCC